MSALYLSICFTLISTITFSFSSVLFRKISELVTPLWMNAFKAVVAFIAFAIAIFFVQTPIGALAHQHLIPIGALLLSGMVGLAIGDTFLLKAFTLTGTTRSFIVFRFQPVFLAIGGWALLHQSLSANQGIGVVILMLCVIVLSVEDLKNGDWRLQGTLFALIAAFLDASGVLLTKHAFDIWPGELHSIHANFIRTVGALLGFVIISRFESVRLVSLFKTMPKDLKILAFFAAFFGTFVALYLWLKAISIGHLATVAAVGGLGPLFVLLFESALYKQWPSRYTWVAVILSIIGMLFIVNP